MTSLRVAIISMGVVDTVGQAIILFCWLYFLLCAYCGDWSAMLAGLLPMFTGGSVRVAAQRGEKLLLQIEQEDREAAQ